VPSNNVTYFARWEPVVNDLPRPTAIEVQGVPAGGIQHGQSSILRVGVTPSNANPSVVWSSNNPSIATIDRYTGRVTAVGGTSLTAVRMTATSTVNSAVSGSAFVAIWPPPQPPPPPRAVVSTADFGDIDTRFVSTHMIPILVGQGIEPIDSRFNFTHGQFVQAMREPSVEILVVAGHGSERSIQLQGTQLISVGDFESRNKSNIRFALLAACFSARHMAPALHNNGNSAQVVIGWMESPNDADM